MSGTGAKFLREQLEAGTFVAEHERVFPKILEALTDPAGSSDPELEPLAFRALAGLALCRPDIPRYEETLLEFLSREALSTAAKMQVLSVIRAHIPDPDRFLAALRLYGSVLSHPDRALADFAARTLLQALTEMRVGGSLESVLAREEVRLACARVLGRLSREGWLEAGELLDLLEL